jgi:hypothetical protein
MLQPDCSADWQGVRLSTAMEIGTSQSQGSIILYTHCFFGPFHAHSILQPSDPPQLPFHVR